MAPNVRSAGAELVIVGSGTPDQAKRFADEEQVIGTMVTDPTLEAYRVGGMRRGVLTVMNAKAALHAVRALRDGHRQRRTQGDPWQQGGVVVVDALSRSGRIALHHAASEAGDPTDFSVVVRAVESLARGA